MQFLHSGIWKSMHYDWLYEPMIQDLFYIESGLVMFQ